MDVSNCCKGETPLNSVADGSCAEEDIADLIDGREGLAAGCEGVADGCVDLVDGGDFCEGCSYSEFIARRSMGNTRMAHVNVLATLRLMHLLTWINLKTTQNHFPFLQSN